MDSALLTLLLLSPLVGVLAMLVTPGNERAHRVALACSLLPLVLTLVALSRFYAVSTGEEAFVLKAYAPWVTASDGSIDISYRVGVDGISIWMLVLTRTRQIITATHH